MSFNKGMVRVGAGLPGLLKDGYKHLSGLEEAIIRNIEAVKKLAQITRTSLGPNGRNKLVINHLEKLFITSDAAVICKELEIIHPAANVTVMAVKQQEEEVRRDAPPSFFVLAPPRTYANQPITTNANHRSATRRISLLRLLDRYSNKRRTCSEWDST